MKGVLHHATNNVLGEHEVAERRSIRFQAHVHANVLPIIPSTGEVQDETSIMSRIMSDATDGVRTLHGYSEYPFNQLLNDVDKIVHEVAEQKLADGLVHEVVEYSVRMSKMTEFRSIRSHAIHHLCRRVSRYHSASQEEAKPWRERLEPQP